MKVNIKGFTTQKVGEKNSDNFDRYRYNLTNNKFAVADGVSLSFFPNIWAKLLVNNFTENYCTVLSDEIPIELDEIQNQWENIVKTEVDKPETMYYVRNAYNLQKSGSATFVGLEFIQELNTIKWKSFVLGDSFLFFKSETKTEKGEISKRLCVCCRIKYFFKFTKKKNPENKIQLTNCFRLISDKPGLPIDCPEYVNQQEGLLVISSKEDLSFNNQPDYFDSKVKSPVGSPLFCEGKVTNGIFYLMTDALADWFLENQNDACLIISKWKNHEDFLCSVNDLRLNNRLKNDDTSVLILEISEADVVDKIFYHVEYYDDIEKMIKLEKQ